MCEKYKGNGTDFIFSIMDFEKPYDKIDRKVIWQVLQVHDVGGGSTKSFEKILQGKQDM